MILVIVESSVKATSVEKYLGDGYRVQGSGGHIRDLPENAEQLPPEMQNEPWAEYGLNPETFEPVYVVPEDKAKLVEGLRGLAAKARRVVLATDGDREGEAIAWHLAEELGIEPTSAERVVFREVTQDAVRAALREPGRIDMNLVAAQEVRRVLDRLVGWEYSKLTRWALKKNPVGNKLSAGRVQTPMLALLVSREITRSQAVSAGFGTLKASGEGGSARLVRYGGERVATSAAFGADGVLKDGWKLLTPAETKELSQTLPARLKVQSVTPSEVLRQPPLPLTTTALQRALAGVSMTADRIMEIAQTLFEKGLITYHRTDAAVLSVDGARAARGRLQVLGLPLSDEPRLGKAAAGSQAAHEAIRPAGTDWPTPEASGLEGKELLVYRTVYTTTLATQMPPARFAKVVSVLSAGDCEFEHTSKVLTDPGFLALQKADEEEEEEDAGGVLGIESGEGWGVSYLAGSEKTAPPSRYTDKSFYDTLERIGLTRPSTLAPAITVLTERDYMRKAGKDWVPTATGCLAALLMNEIAPSLVSPGYTGEMEAELDKVASGERDPLDYLREVWTEDLGPAAEKARARMPPLRLHLPGGVTLEPGPEGPVLRQSGKTVDCPSGPFPFGDFTESDAKALMSGKLPRKRSRRGKKGDDGED